VADPETQARTADALLAASEVMAYADTDAAAELRAAQRAVIASRQAAAELPTVPSRLRLIAALTRHASVLVEQHHSAATQYAVEGVRAARELMDGIADTDPHFDTVVGACVSCLARLSGVLGSAGAPSFAEQVLGDSIAFAARSDGPATRRGRAVAQLAMTRSVAGGLVRHAAAQTEPPPVDPAKALGTAQRTLAALHVVIDNDDPSTLLDFARGLYALGRILIVAGQPGQAANALDDALRYAGALRGVAATTLARRINSDRAYLRRTHP
jgi:hypothetical protein